MNKNSLLHTHLCNQLMLLPMMVFEFSVAIQLCYAHFSIWHTMLSIESWFQNHTKLLLRKWFWWKQFSKLYHQIGTELDIWIILVQQLFPNMIVVFSKFYTDLFTNKIIHDILNPFKINIRADDSFCWHFVGVQYLNSIYSQQQNGDSILTLVGVNVT